MVEELPPSYVPPPNAMQLIDEARERNRQQRENQGQGQAY